MIDENESPIIVLIKSQNCFIKMHQMNATVFAYDAISFKIMDRDYHDLYFLG